MGPRRLLALALAVSAAAAHRPLLLSPVGGDAYSTWETALPVPWVNSSWSAKRAVEVCAGVWGGGVRTGEVAVVRRRGVGAERGTCPDSASGRPQ
jgi:hypothetical protein